jgi:hypothetical protein
MKLVKGRKYDLNRLMFIGWNKDGTEGYNIHDYFRNGKYLGADYDGVEPLFERKVAPNPSHVTARKTKSGVTVSVTVPSLDAAKKLAKKMGAQ